MKDKIYIAGPMTGYPEYNFPAFDAAAERLRADLADCLAFVRAQGFTATADGGGGKQ